MDEVKEVLDTLKESFGGLLSNLTLDLKKHNKGGLV